MLWAPRGNERISLDASKLVLKANQLVESETKAGVNMQVAIGVPSIEAVRAITTDKVADPDPSR